MGGGAVANFSSDAAAYVHLLDPNRKWYNNRRLIALHGWIFLLWVTTSTNGYDGSMMNGLQSLHQWADYFHHPSGGRLGLLNAIQNIGALAAYPFAPYVSDYFGRRTGVFLGATIMIIATAVQTASQSDGMFIGARYTFDSSLCPNAAPMLVTELSYPSYRAQLTAAYNSLWYTGAIIAAWSTYGTFKINNTWAWRIPSALQGITAVLQFALIWFVPESPRYLISKGKDEKAIKTLAYYHADGNQDDPLVKYEYEEIKAALAFDQEVASNVGWKSLIATPGNRKRMRLIVALAFFSQWSGNGMVSYYLNKVFDSIGITNSTIQLLINGILQIWNLAWALAASFMCERLGRRFLFTVSAAGMLIFFTSQTICSARFAIGGSAAAAHAVIAFIFLFYAAYDIAFSPLIVSYTVEILPFNLRAKGFNVFNFSISCALIFNQYINPIAFDAIKWKYYIVYCCWLVVELVVVIWLVVETKGRTLEETAALFDGEGATTEIVDHAKVFVTGETEKEDSEKKSSTDFIVHNDHVGKN
ncbi:hexose transporter [Fistulina hepatica ATCC 64428]|uniref:Hexose transporter n=1 Tax=Fistulina hepatica ATCC 64428 TaxID=1128425 RepID=A0A0D7A9Z1_9AGAR|nr:hexose transporter [Fistulina hepatica ATCC 64428]